MAEGSADTGASHILITGGTRGIGRAVAEEAARRGMRVSVLGRDAEATKAVARELRAGGAQAFTCVADVRDETAVRGGIARAEEELGPVDLLLNNAGQAAMQGPLADIDLAAWWSEVEINLRGVAICAAAVLPSMMRRGAGRIVNMVSGTAGRPSPYNSAYAVAKAAVVRLTDSLHAEVADRGVSVFALRPGNVRTDMTTRFVASPTVARWMPGEASRLQLESPDRAVAAVMWLAAGRGDALAGRWIDADQDLDGLASNAAAIAAHDLHQLRRLSWGDPRATA
jgi:NAD(P)-dependent dehydrogenase (short-subunit alcohol dehydrogenase family)